MDADDPTYTVPEDDIMLGGSPSFFSIRAEGTSILLTVAGSLSGQAGVSHPKNNYVYTSAMQCCVCAAIIACILPHPV